MIKTITRLLLALSVVSAQLVFGQQTDHTKEPSSNDKLGRIVIVRHGQSDHNVLKIMNTNPEHPDYFISNLTDYGKKEVAATGLILRESANIKNDDVVAIYASPLPRTRQTAAIIADQLGLDSSMIEVDNRISEVKAGNYESRSPYEYKEEKGYFDPDSSIETDQDLKNRIYDFYMYINMKHPEGDVIVVTHSHPAALLMEYAAHDAGLEFPDEHQEVILNNTIAIDQKVCLEEACKTQLYLEKGGDARPRTSGFRVYPRATM